MKDAATKYSEAVTRNLKSLNVNKMEKKTSFTFIEKARHHVGIRPTDASFDSILTKYVKA